MKEKLYTNGAYFIRGKVTGFWKFARLKGVVVESKYSMTYSVGTLVNFPVYHTFSCKKPQFVLSK